MSEPVPDAPIVLVKPALPELEGVLALLVDDDWPPPLALLPAPWPAELCCADVALPLPPPVPLEVALVDGAVLLPMLWPWWPACANAPPAKAKAATADRRCLHFMMYGSFEHKMNLS